MNLTYSEQRVPKVFERLSILHSSEKDKADFTLLRYENPTSVGRSMMNGSIG